MKDFTKGSHLEFTVTRDLGSHDIARIAATLGPLGLEAAFPLPHIPTNEELLASHVADTMPRSDQSYVGKEHFWYFGSDFTPQAVGRLFVCIAEPAHKLGRPLTPADIGLVVVSRDKVGFPEVPKGIKLDQRNNHTGASVIQVQGLLELAKNTKTVLSLYEMSDKRLSMLGVIAGGIERTILEPPLL